MGILFVIIGIIFLIIGVIGTIEMYSKMGSAIYTNAKIVNIIEYETGDSDQPISYKVYV